MKIKQNLLGAKRKVATFEKRPKRAEGLQTCTEHQDLNQHMDTHLHKMYVMNVLFRFFWYFLIYLWSVVSLVQLCYIDMLITARQFPLWPLWAYLKEHICSDLNIGAAVRQRLVFSNCWSPWLHKHVVCILCPRGGRERFLQVETNASKMHSTIAWLQLQNMPFVKAWQKVFS